MDCAPVVVIVPVAVLTVTVTSLADRPGMWLATAVTMPSTEPATVEARPAGKLSVMVTALEV